MKKSELLPTPENIRMTFLNDTIGRNKDVISFIKVLDSIQESYSIALDSQWGSGKTFFVKQVEMALNSLNDTSYNRPDHPEEIANLCKWYFHNEHLPRPHVALYYDAWKNDLDDDPLYSFLLTITEATDNQKALKDHHWLNAGTSSDDKKQHIAQDNFLCLPFFETARSYIVYCSENGKSVFCIAI